MSFATEFKEFILRGKVVDLAVGVAVGGAFTKLVESIVEQVLIPFYALFATRVNFENMKWTIRSANSEMNVAEISVHYGIILNSAITFLIVGIVVFFFIKVLNNIYKADTTDQTKITNEYLKELLEVTKQNATR